MLKWVVGHAREWDWDKIDEIVASFARPYQQYLCSTSVAVSLIIATIKSADALVVGALAVPCAGLAGWSATLRSTDKKTQASVEIAKIQPADNKVTAEVK